MIRLRQLVNRSILYNLQFFEYLAMLNVNDISRRINVTVSSIHRLTSLSNTKTSETPTHES